MRRQTGKKRAREKKAIERKLPSSAHARCDTRRDAHAHRALGRALCACAGSAVAVVGPCV